MNETGGLHSNTVFEELATNRLSLEELPKKTIEQFLKILNK